MYVSYTSIKKKYWLLVPIVHKLWICYDIYDEKMNSLRICFVIYVYNKKYIFILYLCFGHRSKTLGIF